MCPQFDILWDELTVEEHLLFYARIKGIAPKDEEFQVTKAIGEVQLEKERTVKIKELPLGMRRRLSIAISLVSDPRVVFLDEPSTGLDPETRRHLWDILQQCK
jgi:ABC-type multidrug transport system ATPase subunit